MEWKIPSYRIGNDIPLLLPITVNGETPAAYDIVITLFDPRGKVVALEWVVTDGTASATFTGTQQRFVGNYVVKVVRRGGEPGMASADNYLFRLVAHSWEADADPASVLPIAGASLADILTVEEIDALHDIISTGIPTLAGRVTELENRATELEDRETAVEERIGDAEGRIGSAEQRITDIENNVATVEDTAAALDTVFPE